MESYALHNPHFYKPIEFSTSVVSFYRDDLPEVTQIDGNFAKVALKAM